MPKEVIYDMENLDVIRSRLAQATDPELHWRTSPENTNFLFTDGVKLMAEMCDAFWLINTVLSWQCEDKVRNEPFQVWRLRFKDKATGDEAFLRCEDGNGRELARQEIEYTDFPLPEGVKLFLSDGVLMLPSEY